MKMAIVISCALDNDNYIAAGKDFYELLEPTVK